MTYFSFKNSRYRIVTALTRTLRIKLPPPPPLTPVPVVAAAVLLAACSSVPGETMAPRGVQREVRERVLTSARAVDPQCRQVDIVNSEVLDVFSDGRSSAERWIVQACARKLNYLVNYPAKKGPGFSVREER